MSEVKKYRADWRHVVETEFDDAQYVGIADFEAQRLRADTAEAELKVVRKSREDELENYNAMIADHAAAEQRNAELSTALRRAKLWVEDRRRFGDYGTIAEDWLMIERTLRELPHPPSEFDASFNPNPEEESHE